MRPQLISPVSKAEMTFHPHLISKSWHLCISHQCLMGSTYCAIAGDTHSDIVTFYLNHFNQSLNCMHIKGCISACLNYGYWLCQIIRLDIEVLFQSLFALQKKVKWQFVHYNLFNARFNTRSDKNGRRENFCNLG